MANKYRLLLRERDRPSPVRQQVYDADERVEVRDLSTRITLQVCARELSPYRHTLIIGGTEYQILNVLRQQ